MSQNHVDNKSRLVQVLGAIREQAITWASFDQDLYHHMIGHNDLITYAGYNLHFEPTKETQCPQVQTVECFVWEFWRKMVML